MDQEQETVSITITGNEALGTMMTGMLEVLISFGCSLSNAGLLDRADIANEMRRMIEQQLRQDNGVRSPRQFPAECLERFFSRPVMQGGRGAAGLVAIDGGKSDDDPPSGA